ncbi:MAG: hypothetical protein GYB66_15075 [Chloroflexi bacterium]|nr:hypothetical protein [Chloroflexota bacterium]
MTASEPAAPFAERARSLARMFVRDQRFVLVLASVIGGLALLVLVSFTFFAWYGDDDDVGSISGLGIWLGGSDEIPSLSLDNWQEGHAGISAVRSVDRLLIIVPVAAITIMVLAGMLVRKQMPATQGVLGMAVVALVIWLFPLLWQGLSTASWQNDLSDESNSENVESQLEVLTDLYSTGEVTTLGFLMVVIGSAGLALFAADQRGLLDGPDSSDSAGVAASSSELAEDRLQ